MDENNKKWVKSLRIWKMISNKIRLTKKDGYYYVETRPNVKENWGRSSTSYESIKRAINEKHNITHRIIRNLGFQSVFVDRRLKRKGIGKYDIERKNKPML